jgi:Zn-dependent protease
LQLFPGVAHIHGLGCSRAFHGENVMNTSIEVTCPSCAFSRTVPLDKLPAKTVNATCPKCKTSFPFDLHVQAPIPHAEVSPSTIQQSTVTAHPLTEAPPASSSAVGKRLVDNPIIAQGIPVVVGIALYVLGTPWYAAVLVVLGAQYWFGPILVYFKQRMPTSQLLRPVPAETSLPPEHTVFLNKTIPVLEAAGFVSKGCFTNAPQDTAISATVTLMQHETTSDVAHLVIVVQDGMVGQTIGLSRPRANGSRIRTSSSTIPSPFPPAPQDNALKIGGEIDPAVLWRVHQARVAADMTVSREEPISDALGYQMNEERQGVKNKLASGQWQQAEQQGFIRPTLPGAYSMCLRMLFPWKQLDRLSAEREVRRHLKGSGGEPVRETKAVEISKDSSDVEQDLEVTSLITELKALSSEEKKSGSLVLLIITFMLFFSAQIISTKWQEILILVGVLFFHELGHLTAMKLLKYTDLKMFFIPFFGAAASGKNINPTALKSCIVSLMGPLPGIVLSVGLYFLFFLTKNYYLFKTAQVMMLLNVFNLLPIMPLDGGRFVDVLFVNRRYFRFVFSLLGAATFLILAASAHDILLGLFGVLTIYVALGSLKLHGISSELKSEDIVATSVTDLIDNKAALMCVIGKIRPHFPKLFSPNMDYKGIYNKLTIVVDTIKFQPAKFLPKSFLLGIYAACTLGSILGLFIFVGANFRESSRTVEVDGKKQTYVEHHAFGKKTSECLINSQFFYDGKGTAYEDDGSISSIYYYKDGYRTGEWLNFEGAGKVVEKRLYDRGRLITVSTLENGAWKTKTVEDMPLLKRCSEYIQRVSQPFKSNHMYF